MMHASHSARRGTNELTSSQPRTLPGHTGAVYSLAFLPDGTHFLSGSIDGTMRTWSTHQAQTLETRLPLACGGIVSTIAVSHDGRWIATGGEASRLVLWDATTHARVSDSSLTDSWHCHTGVVECIAFSGDGTALVSGAGDTTVVVWDVPTGQRRAGPFRGHVDAVMSVVFSPSGQQVASTDLNDVRIWDICSGALVRVLTEYRAWSLAWTPNPSDWVIYAACGDRIKCIDASTGALRKEWTAHALAITSIALSQDGRLIAASSNYAKTVQLWWTATQRECGPVLKHDAFVRCVALSPDGSYVVSGGEDKVLYLWPIQDTLAHVDEASSPSTKSERNTTHIGTTSLKDEISHRDTESAMALFTSRADTDHRGFPNDLTSQVARVGDHPVASGGFADIYRGVFQRAGESIQVAIKVIKTYSGEVGDLSKKHKRLRREIKVWLNLEHPNVLPLFGTTMRFGPFPAMVCPWAENGTLTFYLEDRHHLLSVVEILGLLNNVASGIQYLHSRSVVHGDLSGSNVLIREGGRACIADFGLSMLLTELGGSTFATSFQARGTLRWTAPELLDLAIPEDGTEDESAQVGPTVQNDVYSFGSVMLQILSGKVPYHYYVREAQVVHAVSRGITPRRPDSALVTERRWMFLRRCWSTVDVTRSRPLSEEIVQFIEEELAGARTS